METALAELPLAAFTTLAPIGAGSFIALACVLFRKDVGSVQLQALDRAMIAPFVTAGVGFVASFLHLTTPLHALHAFSGIGSSPLTNEICCGIAFMAAAAAYLALALAGKLNAVRKPFAMAVAVLAAVFVVFIGLAYTVPTIASWNTVLVPIDIAGCALVGGGALMACVTSFSGAFDENARATLRKPFSLIIICGAALALIASVAHVASVADMGNAVSQGSDLISSVLPYTVVGLVLIALSAAEALYGIAKGLTPMASLRSAIESFAGIFLIRLSFYAMYLSVGVTMM